MELVIDVKGFEAKERVYSEFIAELKRCISKNADLYAAPYEVGVLITKGVFQEKPGQIVLVNVYGFIEISGQTWDARRSLNKTIGCILFNLVRREEMEYPEFAQINIFNANQKDGDYYWMDLQGWKWD